MFKVMIVDDESLVRVGLKLSIDWSQYGLSIAGEAANGEQAYKLFLETDPDLVITDLKMPKKDGLWLIRMIRQQNREVPILVLTCYDEFAYVREAMRAGANDYLLKSEIEHDKMDEILRHLLVSIQKNKALRKPEPEPAARYELSNDEIFETLLNQDAGESIKLQVWQDHFPDAEPCHNFALAVLANDEPGRPLSGKSLIPGKMDAAILEIVGQIFQNEQLNVICRGGAASIEMLICTRERSSKDLQVILEIIQTAIQRYCNKSMSGIYSPILHTFDQLTEAFQSIQSNRDQLFFRPGKSLVVLTALQNPAQPGQFNFSSWRQKLMAEILKTIQAEDASALKQLLQTAESELSGQQLNPQEVKMFYSRLASIVMADYADCLEEPVRQRYLDHYEHLMETRRLSEMTRYIDEFFSEVISQSIAYRLKYSRDFSQKVIRYIEKNYGKKLSLDEIAKQVNLSKNYVCSLFKKDTGVSIATYINQVRIQAAKAAMLKENLPVKDIYHQVGFADEQYFCKIFKKMTGQTVTQYKESLGKHK